MKDFIHLNVHSNYSAPYATGTIKEIVDKAISLGMPGIALTDNGNLMGAMILYQYCEQINRQMGINFKPIIGCEINFTKPGSNHQEIHITALAKNLTGYKNLLKIVNKSWRVDSHNTFKTKPIYLEPNRDGLIILSGSITGTIQDKILHGRIEEAAETIQWYKSVFGDDFYLEIQRHPAQQGWNQGLEGQEQQINSVLIQLAAENGVKLVATNYCHFVEAAAAKATEAFLQYKNGAKDQPYFSGQEWIKSQEEMTNLFEDLPEAIDNTMEIFEKCESYSICGKSATPSFDLPSGFHSSEEYLKHLAFKKAENKYGITLPNEVVERLNHELDIVCSRGYADYFLIIEDLVRHAHDELNLWVGPGRSSFPCSLLCYCLGITQIDPLAYQLPFERFMCKYNPCWPDIDLDIETSGKDKLFSYLKNKYGDEHFANIIATQSLGEEVKEQLAREHGLTPNEMSFCKGAIESLGIHGCGIAMWKHDIEKHIPLITINDKRATQFQGNKVEDAGLVKLDLVEMDTLSKMHHIVDAIRKNKNIEINVNAIPLDDEQTLQAFGNGVTEQIFLFEFSRIKLFLVTLKGHLSFDALVLLWSLCCYEKEVYTFPTSDDTEKVYHKGNPLLIINKRQQGDYSIDIFQEEVMGKACRIANFSADDSDILRKALARCDEKRLNECKQKFINGGLSNGYAQTELEEIWDRWYRHRTHHYCKPHAICYTLIAYQMMYLKVHFPEEFEAVMKE